MRFTSVMITIYSLLLCFLLLQIVNCERVKHCEGNERCLKKLKEPKKLSNGNIETYEDEYKQKYEKYAASKNKIENKEPPPLDKSCNKRKYQLNCNKGGQKSKSGEQSMKNGKVYIKRENNPLLNLDNDDDENHVKRKRNAPVKTKEKYKTNSWKPHQSGKLKHDSSSEESNDDEW